MIDPDTWDWEAERDRLGKSMEKIGEQTRLKPGEPVVISFLFVPAVEGAEPVALMRRLREAGFPAKIRDATAERPKCIAATADLVYDAEPIWAASERTARLGFEHGFRPFGWDLTG